MLSPVGHDRQALGRGDDLERVGHAKHADHQSNESSASHLREK